MFPATLDLRRKIRPLTYACTFVFTLSSLKLFIHFILTGINMVLNKRLNLMKHADTLCHRLL